MNGLLLLITRPSSTVCTGLTPFGYKEKFNA